MIASPVQAYVDDDSRSEIGDAALSSDAPHIPEPMVFDLVRPLGVRQGDLEVNALSGHLLQVPGSVSPTAVKPTGWELGEWFTHFRRI